MFKRQLWRLIIISTLLFGLTHAVARAQTETAEGDLFVVTYEVGAKTAVFDQVLALNGAIRHQFDNIRVLAITLDSDAVDTLADSPGVVTVEVDPLYHLFDSGQTVPYGIDMVQARDTWDADRDGVIDAGAPTGEGIKVCVVDTGIYATHEDLGGGGVNIVAGRSWVNEDWAHDLQGHGTHVAGTVAAMNNDVGVVGVSPGQVDLIIADVFNDAGDGQASSTILDAANWCAEQDANVISMSLGGPIGTLSAGYQALYDQGILIVAAAGNDGAPVQSFPASYPSVVSVAAVDSTGAVASFSNFPLTNDVEVAAPGVAVLSTYPFENSVAVAGGPTYSANAIANADSPGATTGPLADGGDCNTTPTAGAYEGQVVLCQRGGLAFRVKIDNAAAGGAIAAVIYNNAPGNFSGTYGDPCCAPIPAVSLSQADGQDALNHLGQNVTVNVNLESAQGYAELSGTSMATPHASSVAAVLWSACSVLSNDQVRSHVATFTLEPEADLVAGRDPFYGFGIVQLKDAVDALFDGVDEYDPNSPNSDGRNPANVECPLLSTEAVGAGWLKDNNGKGLNFGFEVQGTAEGMEGRVKLIDRGTGDKINATDITFVGHVSEPCGSVPAAANSLEFHAAGKFNRDTEATYRVCVQDNGEPGHSRASDTPDLFYLECLSGCTYNTGDRTPDDKLDGGNLQVRSNASDDGDEDDTEATASTMILDPVLLTEGVVGEVALLTVTVYDQNLQLMADAPVTLTKTAADGSVTTFTAITDLTGTAVFSVINLTQTTEYSATSGSAESNVIKVSPLLN